MKPLYRFLVVGCLAVTCLLTSCGTSQHADGYAKNTPAPSISQPGGQDWQWPPPSAFVQPPRAAAVYDPTDLIKHGRHYEGSLPQNAVEQLNENAHFTPSWSAETGLSMEHAAYCHYYFYVEDYDREAEIHWGWSDPPSSLGNAWFGVGNFYNDCWEWFPANNDNMLLMGNMNAYLHSGDAVAIAVVVLGTDPCDLQYIRLGSIQVEARINADRWGGIAPVDIEFDAAASSTEVGVIDNYSWDMDNSGTYELDMGTATTTSENFTENGSHTVGLRVTNNYGVQDSVTYTFIISDPWTHSMGGSGLERFDDMAVDAPDAIYCAGSTGSFGAGHRDLLLARYDYYGNLVWAKAWGGSEFEGANAIAVDSEGNLLVSGYTDSYGASDKDLLLQKWTPEGELEWTSTWGDEAADIGTDVGCRGTDYYVSGYSGSFGGGSADAILVKFDSGGGFTWASLWGGIEDDVAEGLVVRKPVFADEEDIHVTGYGYSYTDPAKMVLFYGRLSADGVMETHKIWNPSGSFASGRALSVYGLISQEVFIVGWMQQAGTRYPILLGASPATETVTKWWYNSDDEYGNGIYRFGDSLYLCGNGGADAFLLRISSEGAYEGGLYYDAPDESDCFYNVYPFVGQGFLLAGSGGAATGGSWTNASGSWENTAGTWSDVTVTAQAQTGILGAPSGTVTDITTAVIDTGGGGDEAILAAIMGP